MRWSFYDWSFCGWNFCDRSSGDGFPCVRRLYDDFLLPYSPPVCCADPVSDLLTDIFTISFLSYQFCLKPASQNPAQRSYFVLYCVT